MTRGKRRYLLALVEAMAARCKTCGKQVHPDDALFNECWDCERARLSEWIWSAA